MTYGLRPKQVQQTKQNNIIKCKEMKEFGGRLGISNRYFNK